MLDAPSGHSPRSDDLHLHGPRPPPLRLNAESRKIRKQQPAAPPPAAAKAKSHRHHPPPPVIIYTVSPKKIHVDPNDFMSVVQRLTGLNSSSSSSSSTLNALPPASALLEINGGGIFPEAQLVFDGGVEMVEGEESQHTSTWQFNGIPAMSQNLFRHATESMAYPYSSLPQFNNTGLHGNMNLNNMISSSQMMNMPSPTSNIDLFNYFSHSNI